jgi:hypothetical protein
MKMNITTIHKEAGKAPVQVTKVRIIPEIVTTTTSSQTVVREAGKEAVTQTTVRVNREVQR